MGEKASLNLEKRYRLLLFKGKSYPCKNTKKKNPRLCLSSVINSLEFFLFTVVFLQPFFLFSLFFLSFSLNAFSSYIPWFLLHSHCTCVIQVLGASPCPIPHLLELSTISCKVACLLFRHHLHINAARELVGNHLMWRKELLQIFVILHSHPLPIIYPSSCREIPLIYYIKGMGMLLTTSSWSSEMNTLLGYG